MRDTLKHYQDQWVLSDPQLLAETFTSIVYKVRHDGNDAVLKILNEVGRDDEAGGAVALEHFDGAGAVRLFAHDPGAHLLEYAGGEDLLSLVEAGRDDEATQILAGVLNTIHQKPAAKIPAGLITLRRRFASLFERAAQQDDELLTGAAAVAEKLFSAPQGECVLHGDMHHENVRRGERGWLAIDPKGLYGERIFDAANILCNPVALPEIVSDENRFLRQAEILAATMSADRGRLLAFTFSFAALSACWSIEDDQDPALALTVAALARSRMP